jgi:tyrosyl-tRNA synthetase
LPKLTPEQLHRITKRGVAEIIPGAEFIERVQGDTPLKLKMGFDPSKPDLHLGHVVGLRKLRQLQDLGHELILIVGDWTAQIGDPSGRSDTRTMLDMSEVHENAESYMRQFFRIVDESKTRAVYQSEWFGKFTLASVIELTSHFTVNQFLHREDFKKRYNAQQPIAITELLYPLLQAYDSVQIEADVEFGGTDQLFNLAVGRELQEKMGQRPQMLFLMPILPGTDGVRRMGKSLGNYIAIEDTPTDMFGKIMSLPDNVVALYFELLTDLPEDELAAMREAIEQHTTNPMDFKKRLGVEMVSWFHSPEAAEAAQAEFRSIVQERGLPSEDEIPWERPNADDDFVVTVEGDTVTLDLPRFLANRGYLPSRSEGKRRVANRAIKITNDVVETDIVQVPLGAIITYGRRRFVRVVRG